MGVRKAAEKTYEMVIEGFQTYTRYNPRRQFKIEPKDQAKMNLYNYYVKLIFMDKERKLRLENYQNHFFNDNTNYNFLYDSMAIYARDETNYLRLNRCPLSPYDFLYYEDRLGLISTSEVYLVKKEVLLNEKEKDVFAMKIQKKKRAASNLDFHLKRAERDLLVGIDSPFVVKLFYSFQDRNYLFLVFELMEGTLSQLLEDNINTEITEEQIKFYIAEIALGIEAIHQLGYIHRDITLENVLISEEGHCKLADMGFCMGPKRRHDFDFYEFPGEKDIEIKYYQEQLFGFDDLRRISTGNQEMLSSQRKLGTPDYMAYEICVEDESLKGNKDNAYDHRVDWYSLGICMYYMIFGQFPFTNNEEMVKFFKNNRTVPFPKNRRISWNAKFLLEKLICRVGIRISNLDDLKKNDFFANFKWKEILDKRDLLKFKDNLTKLDKNSPKFKKFDKIKGKLFEKNETKLAKKGLQNVLKTDSKVEVGGRKKYDWLFFQYDYLRFDGNLMTKLKEDTFRKFSKALPKDESEEKNYEFKLPQ